jgi:hypothetical protein
VGRVVRFSAARVRGWDMMFDAHPLANAGGTDSYELLFLRQPQEALRSRQKRVDVPLRDEVQNSCASNRACKLGHDVWNDFFRGNSFRSEQSNRDRRIEMRAGNMANRVSHG